MNDSDVTIRSLAVGELHLFDSLVLDGPAFGPPDRDFLATAADHHYRPEWTWIAQRGNRVGARAAWWGGPDDAHPVALDWFDLGPDDDRIAVGARLLRRAHESGAVHAADGSLAQLHLFLHTAWRAHRALYRLQHLRAERGQDDRDIDGVGPIEPQPCCPVPALVVHGLAGKHPGDDREVVPGVVDRLVEPVAEQALDQRLTRRADAQREPPADLPVTSVADQPWGMRGFTLTDPSGNHIRIGQSVA